MLITCAFFMLFKLPFPKVIYFFWWKKGHALHNSICSFTKFNLQLRKSPDNPEALQQVKIIIINYINPTTNEKNVSPHVIKTITIIFHLFETDHKPAAWHKHCLYLAPPVDVNNYALFLKREWRWLLPV